VRPHAAPLVALLAAYAGAQTVPRISAGDLKADVSFLASDALEGRATPSKGLEVAAEYIASEFRRVGLEPAGDDGYFQSAAFDEVTPNLDGLRLTLEIGGQEVAVDPKALALTTPAAANLDHAPLERTTGPRGTILLQTPRPAGAPPDWTPAIAIQIAAQPPRAASERPPLRDASTPAPSTPALAIWDAAARAALVAAPSAPVAVSARIPPPRIQPVKLRNVAGILPGSDPALKDTCLLLTAHYDHLGVRASGEGDRIYNGANDDASGTASIIEIARALAAAPSRPKRAILFVAFFGEELGGLGSLYYVHHPLVPLAKTVAEINLEQLGRTDDSEHPKIRELNLTGFQYTTLGATFQKAAEAAGIRAVDDAPSGDSYFARSDNVRFAEAGIPDTTASVAYEFPDYHAVGDEWPKLDYENMALVDLAIALAAESIAGDPAPPQWNAANPRTARYIKAQQTLH